MNTIKRNNLNKELEKLKAIKNIPTGKRLYDELYKLGYTYRELGTGSSSYICSHNIKVLNITSKLYLNGEYLVFGLCNYQYPRQGRVYRGFVKKIID